MSVSLGDLTVNNIQQLKVLNSVLFPNKTFSEKYYKDCLEKLEWSQFGYFNDVNVGGISYVEDEDQSSANIETLGVLPAYRRYGVGSKLLQYVLDNCKNNENIKQVKVNVPTNDEISLNFFKKHGFEIKETIKEADLDVNVLIKNL